jgi:hypothetical protein
MIKEVFHYFEGLDESIQKVNDYIASYHFEFKKYTLDEFREKFSDLISIKEREDYDDTILPDLGFSLSFAFGLDDLKYFNQDQILRDRYIVFLRYAELEKDPVTQIKEGQELLKSGNFENEVNDKARKLIEKLKLFKSGHIKLLSSFEITDNLRCIPNSYSPPSKNKKYIKYSLKETNVEDLKFFKNQFEVGSSSYLNLSFNSFLESYNIENEKLKFIMLMVCLESVYNINGKYIKSNISKYAALTIIQDNQGLDKAVEKIQALYELRNFIVHGDNENIDENEEYKKQLENISQYILALEEIVRIVLKELLLNKKYSKIDSKKKLWDCLNTKGSPE